MGLARDQRVLHIGCTDAPLTDRKLRDRELLHPKLMAVASDIVGVDIDADGLRQLEADLGGTYVHADATDIEALAPTVAELQPTRIIAADVIEHVPDVGRFVAALATAVLRSGEQCRLVVSTPNGLSARTPLMTFAGTELIHPDHRVVYTPASLARTLADTGLHPVEWITYSISVGSDPLRRAFDVVARTASRIRPHLADGLIVIAAPDGSAPNAP